VRNIGMILIELYRRIIPAWFAQILLT